MGWVRRLRANDSFLVWFYVVVPSAVFFVVCAFVIRASLRARIVASVAAGTPPEQVFDQTVGSLYIWGGAAAALLFGTLLALLAVRLGLKPVWAVVEVTRALSRGDYHVRALPELSPSHTYQELTEGINGLATSLERVEKLRRELVGNLAHEIRTPLTNLQGYLEALRDGVIEPTAEALASVHDEVIRLVRLVDALHQLARADALRQQAMVWEPTDLDLLVEQLVRVIAPAAAARSISVTMNLNACRQPVPAHADAMAQVVRNLLRNAVEYTNESGKIRVQTDRTTQVYRLTCLNTGPGISAEDLPFVFNRFYRTDRSNQGISSGVGLGLAVAKELVEAHGGRIGAESKAGWTMVWLEIPLVAGVRLDLQ